MIASVDSAFHMPREALGEEAVSAHVEALTMKPRAATGFAEPEPFAAYRLSDTHLSTPRFYGLKQWAARDDLTIADATAAGDAIDIRFCGTLTAVQTRSLASLAVAPGTAPPHGGILVLPCGYGKTCAALAHAVALGRRTLVLVCKTFLMDQWAAAVRRFTTASVGRIQSDTVDVQDITICMVQSLVARDYGDVLGRFGLVVCDECHNLAAKTFSQALWRVPAAHVLGLSATPSRKDGLERLLTYSMGEIALRVARGNAEAPLVRLRVYDGPRVPEKYVREGQINMAAMVTKLTLDKARTLRIAQLAHEGVCAGHSVLLLSDRNAQLVELDRILRRLTSEAVGFYIGKTKPEERRRVEAECRIILSNYQMCREGLDIPRLSMLIMATPRGDIEQIVGRIQRPCPDKPPPVVEDIVDAYSIFQMLRYKRCAWYRRAGYDAEVFPL